MSNYGNGDQQGYFSESSNYRPNENSQGASSFQDQGRGGNPFLDPQSGSGAPTGVSPADTSGFLSSLFDFSFNTFITPKVVKLVYLISAGVIGLVWLGFLIGGFADNLLVGLSVLIVGPFIALLYLVFIRLTLEFYLAVVRMSEDIHNRLH